MLVLLLEPREVQAPQLEDARSVRTPREGATVSSFTQLGSTASESSTSQQAASSLGNNIKQTLQAARTERPKISSSDITKEASSSDKRNSQSRDSLNKLSHPFDPNLVHKKASAKELRGQTI